MANYITTIIGGLELNTTKNISELLSEHKDLSDEIICKTNRYTKLQYLGYIINPQNFIEYNLSELVNLASKYNNKLQKDKNLINFIQNNLEINDNRLKFDLFIFDKSQLC